MYALMYMHLNAHNKNNGKDYFIIDKNNYRLAMTHYDWNIQLSHTVSKYGSWSVQQNLIVLSLYEHCKQTKAVVELN